MAHQSTVKEVWRLNKQRKYRCLEEVDFLIVRQRQALQETADKSTGFVAAATVPRLLEKEHANIIEELDYNPRTN